MKTNLWFLVLVLAMMCGCDDIGPAPEATYAGAAGSRSVGVDIEAVGTTDTFTTINSNHGAQIYNDGSSNKHKCLRALMMATSGGQPDIHHQWNCVSDSCNQVTSPFQVVSSVTGCYDSGGTNPLRTCKLTFNGGSYRALLYTQASAYCMVCDGGVYDGTAGCSSNPENGMRQDASFSGSGSANTRTRVFHGF
jgi:hypothetical protein